MGVYIKGMEMPKNCMLCPLCVEEADPANGEMCMVTGMLMPPCTRERLDNCPLLPVPPHGRLIDADAFKKIVASSEHMDAKIFDGKMLYSDHLCVGSDYEDVCKAIDETPTTIPADEGA